MVAGGVAHAGAADHVMLVADGAVAEHGRPRDLLAQGGLYARLCDVERVGWRA